MKEKIERWIGRPLDREYFHDLLILFKPIMIYAPIYMIWFICIERHRFAHYAVIHTAVDDIIPFVEVFVIPYYMWFLYVSVTLVFMMLMCDIEDYYKNFIFLATGMTIFLVISTVFPNMHQLRPSVFPRDNFFTHLVGIIYASDTPANLWPSIHVYNSLGTMIAIHRSKRFNKLGKVISDLIGVSIILSTLFIKQHSMYDVITAFIMATVFYLLIYHTSFVEAFCKKREEKLAYYNQ